MFENDTVIRSTVPNSAGTPRVSPVEHTAAMIARADIKLIYVATVALHAGREAASIVCITALVHCCRLMFVQAAFYLIGIKKLSVAVLRYCTQFLKELLKVSSGTTLIMLNITPP